VQLTDSSKTPTPRPRSRRSLTTPPRRGRWARSSPPCGPPGGPPAPPLICAMAVSTPPSDGLCPGPGGSPRPPGPAWGGGPGAAPRSTGSLGQASLTSMLLLWEQGHSEAGGKKLLEPGLSLEERGHQYTGDIRPISAGESKGE
jgi:hypothetical protein